MEPTPAAGGAPAESIIALTRALVRIPTRAGVDGYEPLFELLQGWLVAHGVVVERLAGPGGGTVALIGRPPARGPRWYLLDATVDTAPFGDVAAWTRPPAGAEVTGGWMYGRGTADSKAGVAVFAHLVAEAAARPAGELAVVALFDADEHTGGFAGLQAYLDDDGRRAGTAGALIGYPGNDRVVVGSRGFLRAVLDVAGQAAHSGSRHRPAANAIARAARLVARLDGQAPGGGEHPDFPLPAKVTVTAIEGGEGFSIVPDRCTIAVDVRLTPGFDAASATEHLRNQAAALDQEAPGLRPTGVEVIMSRPPYRLPSRSPLAAAVQAGADEAFGRRPPLEIVGPSNAGNVLAEAGIEATAGFGVTYRNLHGVDEAIDVATISPVYRAYRRAVERLTAAAGT